MSAANQIRIQVKKTENMLSDVAKSIGSALGSVAVKTGIAAKPATRRSRRRRPAAAVTSRKRPRGAAKRRQTRASKRGKSRR